jgi:hypothetical protein
MDSYDRAVSDRPQVKADAGKGRSKANGGGHALRLLVTTPNSRIRRAESLAYLA